ncbi:hypothetical protein [Phyllobacterium chamaecytisi]|uniref:hypothetical protein n=1 Tax=Phyllobacterium chamaecytisi TaxID=2876082 RepID=UPI001CCA7953|nr:hypothetical protein [Phyllobacterium sp. KW56]MBZ9605526.1 hypothetical protein [Phyllobacterium sp. KW56]
MTHIANIMVSAIFADRQGLRSLRHCKNHPPVIGRNLLGKNVEKADLQTVNFSAEDTVTIERSGAPAPWRRTQQDAKNLGQADDGRPGRSRKQAEL